MLIGFFTLFAIFALTMVRGRSSHDVSTSSQGGPKSLSASSRGPTEATCR
jgi:hypothetical protein